MLAAYSMQKYQFVNAVILQLVRDNMFWNEMLI